MSKGYMFIWMPWRFISSRWIRLGKHIIYPIFPFKGHLPSKSIVQWVVDLIFYVVDLLFIAELYLFFNILFKKNIRRLQSSEITLIQSVYGHRLLTDHVWIDDKASFLARKHRFAYVSFNMVNWWHSMSPQVFIHELMHVYQFQKFGFVYVYRALLAQHSAEGYDYGGSDGLIIAKENGIQLWDFNFEQQASIIEHYYQNCIANSTYSDDKTKSIYTYYHGQL